MSTKRIDDPKRLSVVAAGKSFSGNGVDLLGPAGALIGRAIGNFAVTRKLGEGGMGSVFLLEHTVLPRTFAALKVLSEASLNMRDRFEQEALVAAAIGSHRVVKPWDVGELREGLPYIVMEYVEGRSLEAEFGATPIFAVERAVKIAVRIADTMVAAHDAGFLHRDLKPPNVMLERQGGRDFRVRILDWGVARAPGAYKRATTHVGLVLGSPGYWSPEASMGQPCDGRADVFSLGVILYRMLAGVRPYPTGAGADFLTVMQAPPPASMNAARAGFDPAPPRLDALVQRMIARDRGERPWMQEVHDALLDVLDAAGSGADAKTAMSVVRSLPGLPSELPTRAGGDEVIRQVIDFVRGEQPAVAAKPLAASGHRRTTIDPAPIARAAAAGSTRRAWIGGAFVAALAVAAAGGALAVRAGTSGAPEPAHERDVAAGKQEEVRGRTPTRAAADAAASVAARDAGTGTAVGTGNDVLPPGTSQDPANQKPTSQGEGGAPQRLPARTPHPSRPHLRPTSKSDPGIKELE